MLKIGQNWGKTANYPPQCSTKIGTTGRETFLKIRDTLFDISKPDIKENLCTEDYDFIVDQQTNRKFTFGSVDKNVQRHLLRKRSCEVAQQQREDKAAKKICLIKEIFTGPLEGISRSESDSAGSETSQGLISETAGASRQDFVKFYVPKRIATTSQVASAADRHRISSNVLNDVLAAIIRESNGDVNELVLSKESTFRGRKQARHPEFENNKENFENRTIREFVTIHWDKKLLEQSGDVQQTPHIAVLSSNGLTNGTSLIHVWQCALIQQLPRPAGSVVLAYFRKQY